MRHQPSIGLPGVTLALSLAFGVWSCATAPESSRSTETAADLFDTSTLHDLTLHINPADLAQLRANYFENTYYSADLEWRSTRVRNVAVRSRGFSSRNPNKLGLHVDIDLQTPGQTFLGLQALVLDNLSQDPTMMHEALAMALFARMGQAAPRVSFCRLYINDEYEGLYSIIEDIDPTFLERTFGQDDGYLYEYHWLQRFDGEYLGNDLAAYRPIFEARTHRAESDWDLYDPIRALFEAINAPDEIMGRADVEARVDLEQFVSVLAVEIAMGDEDGFAGYFGMDNFYLYRAADSTRHSFIVWDRDRAFSPALLHASIFDRVHQNALARRAFSYDDLLALYLSALADSATTMSANGWLSSEIDRLWTLVSAAAYADTRKPYSNVEFEDAVNQLRAFAIVRPGLVLNEVAAARGGGSAGRR